MYKDIFHRSSSCIRDPCDISLPDRYDWWLPCQSGSTRRHKFGIPRRTPYIVWPCATCQKIHTWLGGTLDLADHHEIGWSGEWLTVEWNGISDHALVSFSVNAAKPTELCLPTMARTWKNFEQALFNKDLMESDICQPECTLNLRSVDDVFEIYSTTLTRLLDKHAPYVKCSRRPRHITPWFDDGWHVASHHGTTVSCDADVYCILRMEHACPAVCTKT